MKFYPEGWLINKPENQFILKDSINLIDAINENKIVEAKATVCDKNHNLIVDLGCMKGIVEREEGALGIREGITKDIAIISRVNKPVCFIIKEIKTDKKNKMYAILSRKGAQEICINNYIKKLIPGDVINARVTHIESFGVFVDIGCGIISFLPIDSISVSRISHPKERFLKDMDIRVIVKNISNSRINLTHKELLGTWEENAKLFSVGETVGGIIRSVEDYGIFVELTPNLAGLAEIKSCVEVGQQASVYIKNIIPSRMKIKLIIIDVFSQEYIPSTPNYFYTKDHISEFLYSPSNSNKIINSFFG